jgi:hypothetical protein
MSNQSQDAPRGNAKPASPRSHGTASTPVPDHRRRHIEALLDAALADSFPASDPTAITVDH